MHSRIVLSSSPRRRALVPVGFAKRAKIFTMPPRVDLYDAAYIHLGPRPVPTQNEHCIRIADGRSSVRYVHSVPWPWQWEHTLSMSAWSSDQRYFSNSRSLLVRGCRATVPNASHTR